MIHQGDCIEVMRGMEADSVDAVVTDPPYGLGFMGKEWDNAKRMQSVPPSVATRIADGSDVGRLGNYPGGKGQAAVAFNGPPFQAWCTEWGREALRVTRPGGYLLAFGGTRTHHRLVCGLEDAGWIIRDELTWVYASGFPKGKANLKPAHEPIVLARKPGPLRPLAIDANRIPTSVRDDIHAKNPHTEGGFGHAGAEVYGDSNGAPVYDPKLGRWPSNLLLQDPELFDTANPYVVGSGAVSVGGAFPQGRVSYDVGESWGKGMKGKVNEERTDLDGGGYSRFFKLPSRTLLCSQCGWIWNRPSDWVGNEDDRYGCGNCGAVALVPEGDYPRFLILPKADRADREPVLRGQLPISEVQTHGAREQGPLPQQTPQGPIHRENSHPTVKPVDLMRHLVRLVTPTGGTVLDCFLGSGSTAIAAEMEGFDWIGIEKEPEYVKIAEARLNGIQKGLGLAI